jgi:hypothetical protein
LAAQPKAAQPKAAQILRQTPQERRQNAKVPPPCHLPELPQSQILEAGREPEPQQGGVLEPQRGEEPTATW